MSEKLAIIIRGIPGSGKSTLAKTLMGKSGVIHSTDDYFLVEGVYKFDPKSLGKHHEANYNAFKKSILSGISPVILDNTNTQKWEYSKYESFAKQNGYEIQIIKVPHVSVDVAVKRNTHGVPEASIKKMLERWED